MSADTSPPAAAVPGLIRSDPRGPGITRERVGGAFRYHDPSGLEVTSPEILRRLGALGIPPAWKDVWISADPLGVAPPYSQLIRAVITYRLPGTK